MKMGPKPSVKTTEPNTTRPSPDPTSTWVSIASPVPVTTRPPATPNAGRISRETIGDASELSTTARDEGSDHRAASHGDSPTTSWRYCAKNRNIPKPMKPVMVFEATEMLNFGTRNSLRSISGSSSIRCRRTKAAPTRRPARIEPTAMTPTPS
jgi:hypothetical protein